VLKQHRSTFFYKKLSTKIQGKQFASVFRYCSTEIEQNLQSATRSLTLNTPKMLCPVPPVARLSKVARWAKHRC